MTHPIPSETIEYEHYVDGLRRTGGVVRYLSGQQLRIENNGKPHGNRKLINEDGDTIAIACVTYPRDSTIGNARLLAAAYNAFDSAARELRVNAVQLAERMQDGEIAELFYALENLIYAHPVFRSKPVGSEGSQARIHQEQAIEFEDKAKAVLAKVKGHTL